MTKQNLIKAFGLAILVVATGVFQGCKKSSDSTTTSAGDWQQRGVLSGSDRSNAVAFEINGLGYLGTGFDGTNRLNDFWKYDADSNGWEQKADFPGAARSEAIGFSILGKGYIGLGTSGSSPYLIDFYEYDPGTNTWTQKSDFGTTIPAQAHAVKGRYGAVAFTIGSYGYVGTGNDGSAQNSFFKYDPSADIWSTVVSYPGQKRESAIAFVAGGNAYVGTGIYNGIYQKDFYQYNPTTEVWRAVQNLENGYDLKRYGAAAFAINGKGYICSGTYTSVQSNTWEFTPPTTTNADDIGYWTQKGDFEGVARTAAVGLSIGNRGYVLTGKNGNIRYGDMWELKPYDSQVW